MREVRARLSFLETLEQPNWETTSLNYFTAWVKKVSVVFVSCVPLAGGIWGRRVYCCITELWNVGTVEWQLSGWVMLTFPLQSSSKAFVEMCVCKSIAAKDTIHLLSSVWRKVQGALEITEYREIKATWKMTSSSCSVSGSRCNIQLVVLPLLHVSREVQLYQFSLLKCTF